MQSTVYKLAAYATLFVDAYLVLAFLASQKMPREYHYCLPPFGIEGVNSLPGFLVLIGVAWTAFLATGILRGFSRQPHAANSVVAFWILPLLIVVWLGIVLTFVAAGLDIVVRSFWHSW